MEEEVVGVYTKRPSSHGFTKNYVFRTFSLESNHWVCIDVTKLTHGGRNKEIGSFFSPMLDLG